MSSNNEEQNNQFAKAVKNLLLEQDVQEYTTELNLLFLAFVKSDLADSQKIREELTCTYQNLQHFLTELSNIKKN